MGTIVDNMSTDSVIGGMRAELETQAAVQSSVSIKHGSVLDFVYLLQGVGIDLYTFFSQFYDYDLADMGNLPASDRNERLMGWPFYRRLAPDERKAITPFLFPNPQPGPERDPSDSPRD